MTGLFMAFVLAQAADLATTHLGLSRGCQELNPIYGANPTLLRLYILKIVGVMIIGFMAWGVQNTPHPHYAKLMLWTGIVVGVGAAVWNVFQIPKC